VCVTQRPAYDDQVGRIILEMSERVDARRGAPRPRAVTVDETHSWAAAAGFTGDVYELSRQWRSSPVDELKAIAYRTWPAMRELDEVAVDEVTRPAIEALQALPATEDVRRATAEMIVLHRP
jgi:hypothetical protein